MKARLVSEASMAQGEEGVQWVEALRVQRAPLTHLCG